MRNRGNKQKTNNKMTYLSPNLSILTLNLSGLNTSLKDGDWGFPGGAVVENLPANAGDVGSSPGLGRSHMPRSN